MSARHTTLEAAQLDALTPFQPLLQGTAQLKTELETLLKQRSAPR